MPDVTSEKLQKLSTMLEREPEDTFLLYAIGMEYRKLAAFEKAIEFFNRVISVNAGYCYAYYQRGQVYQDLGKTDLARTTYEEGIAAARRVGDAHALSELETALTELG